MRDRAAPERQRARSGDPVAARPTRIRRCRRRSTRGLRSCGTQRSRPRQQRVRSRRARTSRRPGSAICSSTRSPPPTRCTTTSQAANPPFSGGERDAINCVQLYRVTHDKKHLDLAKHYLDIRGLPNSVNRSRHNQSYKPVLEQSEAVGHAVNCASLMVSLADVGVLTGLNAYLDAAHAHVARRRRDEDVHHRRRRLDRQRRLRRAVLAAEHLRVLRDVRGADVHHAEPSTVSGDGRQPVHRRHGTRHVQQRRRRRVRRAATGSSTSTGSPAPATDATRWERASLECCPPNLVRFLASMPGFIYAQDHARRDLRQSLCLERSVVRRSAASRLSLAVESEMPWGGTSTDRRSRRRLARRGPRSNCASRAGREQPVPGALYAYTDRRERQSAYRVNGKHVSAQRPTTLGYVSLDRVWKNGDVDRRRTSR